MTNKTSSILFDCCFKLPQQRMSDIFIYSLILISPIYTTKNKDQDGIEVDCVGAAHDCTMGGGERSQPAPHPVLPWVLPLKACCDC